MFLENQVLVLMEGKQGREVIYIKQLTDTDSLVMPDSRNPSNKITVKTDLLHNAMKFGRR